MCVCVVLVHVALCGMCMWHVACACLHVHAARCNQWLHAACHVQQYVREDVQLCSCTATHNTANDEPISHGSTAVAVVSLPLVHALQLTALCTVDSPEFLNLILRN